MSKNNNSKCKVLGTRHWVLSLVCGLLMGCGYTFLAALPNDVESIAVVPFQNHTFEPGVDIDFNKVLTERLLFERIAQLENQSTAEAILKGDILEFHRDPLRLSDGKDVEEYRLRLVIRAELEDRKSGEVLWQENRFEGETTYFLTGSLAKAESEALKDLYEDLSRRLVGRLAEGWT